MKKMSLSGGWECHQGQQGAQRAVLHPDQAVEKLRRSKRVYFIYYAKYNCSEGEEGGGG